jgi:membrane-bound serine protease (ClpP class)
MRGRSADWAEKAARGSGKTLTAEEAVRERVVDLVASDLNELLVKIDGRTVVVAGVERTLVTAGKPVTSIEPDWRMRVLAAIADPNIAIILLMVGFYGILFEFWSPGAIAPGITGAISLLLGLVALSVPPVSFGALALVLLGLALITAEAFAPGFGLLGIGGVAASIIGAIFLFDPAGADIDLRVGWPVIVGVALSGTLALSLVLGFAVRARQRRTVTGAEEMIGIEGQVVGWEGSEGTVRAHGELWSARGPAPLAADQRVRVVAREGLVLTIEPV